MSDLCINFGCDLAFIVKKSYWGFAGVLAGNVFPLFKMDLCDLPMTDSIVYLGVKFKF